jgi:hypothetical protein
MNNTRILGTWAWVCSTEGNNIVASSSSGVKKSLVFTKDDILYVSHNDSLADYANLEVFPLAKLYSKPVLDTETYSFTTDFSLCSIQKFEVLSTKEAGTSGDYQYALSGDSLKIFPSPCLAPVISIFIRQ